MPAAFQDALHEELLQLVDRIARAADVRAASGMRVIRVRLRRLSLDELAGGTARVVEAIGFAAVRADAVVSAAVREELCHRHVVLFASADVTETTRWIRDLTRASTRSHLLVLIERAADYPRGVHECVPLWGTCETGETDWRRHVRHRAADAVQCLYRGELQQAESLLQAIVAEAAVRHERVDPVVQLHRAALYFWQGRLEAADSVLRRLDAGDPAAVVWRALIAWAADDDRDGLLRAGGHVPASTELGQVIRVEQHLAAGRVRDARRLLADDGAGAAPLLRTLRQWLRSRCSGEGSDEASRAIKAIGAHGIFRWGLGRRGMNLLHGVTALLQVVHDAEDEFHALRHGCAWIRRETCADASALAATDGTLVVADAVTRSDLEEPDVRDSIRGGRGRTIVDGPRAVVISPVRYGGVTIGCVIIRGPAEAAGTLADAGAAFASACAPAFRARLDALACSGASESLTPEILGRSPAIAGLREAIARAASTQFPVLVEGESGTGKELVARALHRLSARRDRRFSALNCAALSDELVEAELFGHARGAFTGALNARAGLFEDAHGGTLFLDEVSELSPRAQAKLLRVLQEREIRRVGEHAARSVDVRVIAATNVPLGDAAARGAFRQDLLFRLAVVRIRIAPLRERIEDVPLLAHACWRSLIAQTSKRALLGPDAIAALCRHRWPGNVRELQNAVAALVVAAPSRGRVTARHVAQVLTAHGAEPEASAPLDVARRAFERRMVASALARHGGRQIRAARDLGLSRQGLAKAIKRLGLGYYRPGAEVRAAPHRDDAPGAAGRRDARLLAHSSGAR